MAGFRCKICKLETKKLVEIRKHLSLSHKCNCSFCKVKYISKNQLDVLMEEYHMDQVMMYVVGGDKSIVNDVAPEKQPYLTSLGVNICCGLGQSRR